MNKIEELQKENELLKEEIKRLQSLVRFSFEEGYDRCCGNGTWCFSKQNRRYPRPHLQNINLPEFVEDMENNERWVDSFSKQFMNKNKYE